MDGNQNTLEVLSKEDLNVVGQLKTDNSSVFSFLVVGGGNKVFAGCSGNNLFVFEIDASDVNKAKASMKLVKQIKSTSIIYCFLQYDYNSILCGQRDGQLQIVS